MSFSAPGSHQEKALHLVVMCPWAFLYYDNFSDFPCFLMTLTVLRSTDQVFCRMFLNWALSDVFLMVKTGIELLKVQSFILILFYLFLYSCLKITITSYCNNLDYYSDNHFNLVTNKNVWKGFCYCRFKWMLERELSITLKLKFSYYFIYCIVQKPNYN